MSDRITIEELVARNSIVAVSHKPEPTFAYLTENGIAVAKTLVIACADPRSDPAYSLGLNFGDAGILRNVGGQVKPLLNDILALDNLLGFNQVMVIRHTDCGTTHFTNEQVRHVVFARDPTVAVGDVDFGAIDNLPNSIIRDVKFLKESSMVHKELKQNIRGFLYNIELGKLQEIVV